MQSSALPSPEPPSSSSRPKAASVASVPPPNAVAARAIGKRPRMSKFRRMLLLVTAVTHVPFAVAAAEALQRAGAPALAAWAGALGLVALGMWLFFGRASHIADDDKRPWTHTFLVDVPYFVHWCACLWCLVPSLVYLLVEPIVDLARGAAIGPSAGFFMWTYAAGLVVCGYGVTLRRWWFVVRRIDIRVRGLDKRLDGLRIAHLSDMHVGAVTPAWWAARWIRRANAEAPDLVVVTGDMVTSGVAFHDDIAALVGDLRSKDGVYVSMGNHDYFGEGEPLISLLEEKGANVLRNRGVVIERDGAPLYLAAIDDTWTKRANLDQALEARPDGAPCVLLAHDPDRFPLAVERGVDVVVSGHTHGGQIAVPFLGRWLNASMLAHHFHIGVYEKGDSTLFVSPGLGTTGPPIRLGVAPAIAILTLRAA